MSLSIGIVGLPNVGKSTLFNALTRASALASNYPFATIEPNVGVVGVPDPRLAELAKLYDSARVVPASVRFTDIAGLVRGASTGQGLGNQFLAHIRETDAICQVVRVFADPDVTHVDGDVSPERDIETVVTELILADLQTLEKALPRLAKETKFAKDPARAQVAAAAGAAQKLLDTGVPLSSGAAAAGIEIADLRELQLLTAKPFLYVFNMDVSELADAGLRKRLSALVAPAEAIFLDAKTEADLAELPEDEAAELLAEAGLGEPGLAQLARAGFRAPWPADLPDRGSEGDQGLGDQGRGDGPGGGGCHPHRLPARLHQGRGGLVRRPDRGRLAAGGPGRRARPASKARTTSCATATSWSSATAKRHCFSCVRKAKNRRAVPVRRKPASVALTDPHRYVGGFQGLLHDTGQVITDRVRGLPRLSSGPRTRLPSGPRRTGRG